MELWVAAKDIAAERRKAADGELYRAQSRLQALAQAAERTRAEAEAARGAAEAFDADRAQRVQARTQLLCNTCCCMCCAFPTASCVVDGCHMSGATLYFSHLFEHACRGRRRRLARLAPPSPPPPPRRGAPCGPCGPRRSPPPRGRRRRGGPPRRLLLRPCGYDTGLEHEEAVFERKTSLLAGCCACVVAALHSNGHPKPWRNA